MFYPTFAHLTYLFLPPSSFLFSPFFPLPPLTAGTYSPNWTRLQGTPREREWQ